jgi:hypothetical protein
VIYCVDGTFAYHNLLDRIADLIAGYYHLINLYSCQYHGWHKAELWTVMGSSRSIKVCCSSLIEMRSLHEHTPDSQPPYDPITSAKHKHIVQYEVPTIIITHLNESMNAIREIYSQPQLHFTPTILPASFFVSSSPAARAVPPPEPESLGDPRKIGLVAEQGPLSHPLGPASRHFGIGANHRLRRGVDEPPDLPKWDSGLDAGSFLSRSENIPSQLSTRRTVK